MYSIFIYGNLYHVEFFIFDSFCRFRRILFTFILIFTNQIFYLFFSEYGSLPARGRIVIQGDSLADPLSFYMCHYCNRSYKLRTQLTYHVKNLCHKNPQSVIFGKGKSHVCDTCGVRFTHASNLSSHKKYNCGVIHRCPKCGKSFAQKSFVTRHLKNAVCSKILPQFWS